MLIQFSFLVFALKTIKLIPINLILVFLLSTFCSCHSYNSKPPFQTKINGVSFVSTSKPLEDSLYQLPRKLVTANSLAIMPFGFIQDQESAVNYNLDWQWWGEKEEGVRQMIRAALKENYRVMLKPQLWLKGGKYTGQLSFEKNADWKILEASYRDFILDFAHLAAEEKVDLFCIGTELEQFTQERSYFWKQLIKEIKEVYQGPLTYASNWDEYQEVPFWQELDLIGIDAYFPLTKKTEPTKKELNKAMRVYSRELKQFSLEKGKPILFTEYGYCSKKGTTIEPWKHDRNAEVDLEAQTLALECFYDTFWEEEYIAGGFLWKWFPNHTKVGGKNHPGFTPQNKPAEKVVFQAYKEFN